MRKRCAAGFAGFGAQASCFVSMPPLSPVGAQAAYSIAAVERESGLSKDTLRMWERRYGFPSPGRDAQGERVYPAAQVERLRLLRRLIHAGHRPGKIVMLGGDALEALLVVAAAPVSVPSLRAGRGAARVPATALQSPLVAQCLDLIAVHDVGALREQLARAVLAMGLEACVLQLVAPLTREVGLAWLQGRFQVFEEHLYTECVTGLLRGAIASVSAGAAQGAPRVLLTTFTQEPHGLGLLMLEALLALQGCACLSLGTQTPHADIARAAAAFRADIVALSFSGILPAAQVRTGLREMRAQLREKTHLWAGGQGAVLAQGEMPGVTAMRELGAVAQALADWRAARL